MVHKWGFSQAYISIEMLLNHEDRFLAAAIVLTRFLDLAIICFSGAHVEHFDEKYLKSTDSELTIFKTIVLRSRSLKYLEEYLHQQRIWVFKDVEDVTKSTSKNPLYISTSIREFNCIWGPVWATFPECSKGGIVQQAWTCPVLSYNIGRGWIIPWKWNPFKPEPLQDELFAHRTKDEADLDNAPTFPVHNSEQRLVMGASPSLSVNKRCGLNADHWISDTTCLNRLNISGTKKHTRSAIPKVSLYNSFASGCSRTNRTSFSNDDLGHSTS